MEGYDNIEFEWDERKRLLNLAKHGLDFREAGMLFINKSITEESARNDESRLKTTGYLNGELITVIWIGRRESIRIISMRKARHEEKRKYKALHA